MNTPLRGALAGPLQVDGVVLANDPAGDYRVLTVHAPGVPARSFPGQFAAIAVGGADSAMLGRRAFSIYEAAAAGATRGAEDIGGDTVDGHGNTSGKDVVRVVVAVHGQGTAWLADAGPGQALDVVAPLGRPFTPSSVGADCVLVGGGYGSAPLFSLADELLGWGQRVHIVLGAATAGRLFGVERARRTATSTTVTTVDGSLGHAGVVTDVLPSLLRGGGADGVAAVYACGPMAMLRATAEIAARHGVPAEVAVEESMACGIGVCMTCVLPVVGEDGVTRMTRSCVDGPVFPGTAVRWADVGTVPADAWGAGRAEAADQGYVGSDCDD